MSRRLVVALVVASTSLGCHSTATESQPDAARSETGSPHDAGTSDDGAWSPVCPDTVPPLGSSCTSPSGLPSGPFAELNCEYGDAWWNISCDTLVVCDQSSWTTAEPIYAPCSSKPGPNSQACPATPAYSDRGALCPDAGLTCYYGLGAACFCVEEGDAGPTWSCQPDPPGCPDDRPRVGVACTGGAECWYGGDGFGVVCISGVWQPTYYGASPIGDR